ncbi:hypothetical protein Rhe02_37600 [Rhizocola hellebori]|uniref:Uncharacterized protein n=1 Tax=Rhizocola hellebori TaxID=1392758 RepID=A0A8J3Q9K6_9ACTN|nr:hypothetical protein [Rhizocola hellebori]GIH05693.1 hypothetical protein Rhe02_37600 [Rhizocola hellebori]
MNQQPSANHDAIPTTDRPWSPIPTSDPDAYLIPADAADRDHLVAALHLAVQATHRDLGCPACAESACTTAQHQPRLEQVRAWRTLADGIGRLPTLTGDEPMIRFDPQACRTWLDQGAARRAGIDEGFNSDAFTIAAGLEELLYLLHHEAAQHVWCTVAHLDDVEIWRTADSHGVDGGGILTADLTYMGTLVRLASLHQGSDEFTNDPTVRGVDAAVQALGHVARTNREYANLRRATGHPLTRTDTTADSDTGGVYTVVGVWLGDQPVPVGVIAGAHEVSGGDEGEHFPEGVWATSVTAADDHQAERDAIEQMRDDDA